MAKLAFSKDQIKVILQEFVTFLQSEDTMMDLKRLAPSEDKISTYIEDNQRKIFSKHGVNPEKGMSDLSKIASVWKSEQDIVQLLMFLASKEELVVQEALGENTDPDGTKFRPQMIQLSFDEMKKQLDIIKTDKNALMQFQLGMQKQMMSLPPDQRQEFVEQLNKSLSPEQKEALQKIQGEQMQQMQQIMQQQYNINAPPKVMQADKSGKQEDKPQSNSMQAPKPQTISQPPSNPNANSSNSTSTSTTSTSNANANANANNSDVDALQQQMQMLLQMQQTQIQQPPQF